MNWLWKKFADLTVEELYQVIQLRERVFVVEQNCVYLDCDGSDKDAWHLLGYQNQNLVAYLRVFPPNFKFKEASFGRVVTAPEVRKSGCGKELTHLAIKNLKNTFGETPIRISAQAYLEKFYGGFGFRSTGKEYLEDGIPHVEMLLV